MEQGQVEAQETKVKVLAVDDHPHNLTALEMMLEPLAVDLVKASSGSEALRQILTHDFALILMDVHMPQFDGFETAAIIRQRDRTRHVPIVFMTASYESDMHMKGYSLGAVDYLNKPLSPQVLQAKVSAFVELYRKTEEVKRQGVRETQQARQQLLQVFEATPDLVATASADGKIQYLNRAGRRMLGIGDEDDISAKKFTELLPPDIIPQTIRDGMWRGETYFTGRDEKPIPVSQVILAHTNDDEIEFFSTIARDMTEQKDLEQQLRQAQKLEGIGQLAGGVAHDFNNLLTVILGRSQMLQLKLDPGSPLQRDAELILRTGERATALTRQLLAFSRKQILQPRVLDLNHTVLDMEKMLRRLIGEDVELTTALAGGIGHVKADPGQIEQVILNLAVNARDAMPRGGKLMIETANVELDQAYAARHVTVKPGPYVMLAVSDNGCGMTPQVQSRIFEPFFTTKEQGKGTGLGLATVYGIVKQTGGNIWVYSEVDRGTTFKIYLPRVDAAAEPVVSNRVGTRSLRGDETILIVEDDEIVREHTSTILTDGGYKVLAAADVDDAQRICNGYDGAIHMLLSDVVMPRLKGPDLARRLAARRPTMRVLYFSGYTSSSVTDHGVLDPTVAFLQKPFTVDALLSKVREVLDQG